MTNDFLVEIGCEELPPKALITLVTAFAKGIEDGLSKVALGFNKISTFATPRRLAVKIEGLEQAQKDKQVLRKGPSIKAAFDKDGNASKAALGFAKSCGVDVDKLETIKEVKGEWLAFNLQEKGQATTELLEVIVNSSIKKLPIPKPMRWGNSKVQFVRPVHWLLMMFGSEVVPAKVLGLNSSNKTFGHRFHHANSIALEHVDDYQKSLQQAYVIADFHERKAIIKKQILNCAQKCQAKLVEDESLLDEVTAIVEWPQAVLVDFDKEFLEVPQEALIKSMASHQKCFSLQDEHGQLLPHFITVANIESKAVDHIIKGNERVMRARLSDAAFFYKQDRKTTLEYKTAKLKNIVFQKQLGSVQDKVDRVKKLALFIASSMEFQTELVERAATLSKASLVTEMVGEFPSLQDVMGFYYAKHDGELDEVAKALQEQYLPRFSGDVLPDTQTGSTLALADRVDVLIGIFGINQKPTGVKDPFQLRRASLGIIRILIDGNYNLDLETLLQKSLTTFKVELENKNVVSDVRQFIFDRFYVYLTSSLNLRADVVKAVFDEQSNSLLKDLLKRGQALQPFVESDEAIKLIQGFKRVSNILKGADLSEVKDLEVVPELFQIEEEKALYQAMQNEQQVVSELLLKQEYQALLISLARLKDSVDNYFEKVMVNVDDVAIKQNRLKLLMQLHKLFNKFADLALIQG